MADLTQLQHYLAQSVEEISSLPVEHWECWIIQLIMDLDKKATAQDQQEAFNAMLDTVRRDIMGRLDGRRW